MATTVSHAAPPNVVFFLIDDLGYADCGFNGGQDIRTPNIDRLAKEGTVLESHYVQPVCSPTRAALMTGRYATKTGVYTIVRPHAKWGLPLQERTLANALKDVGYETAITGKWHLGEFDPATFQLPEVLIISTGTTLARSIISIIPAAVKSIGIGTRKSSTKKAIQRISLPRKLASEFKRKLRRNHSFFMFHLMGCMVRCKFRPNILKLIRS